MVQITKDNAYDAVAPDDFPAMLEVERYGNRSTVFDKIISATHDHFWDPLDKKYIDFDEPFDLTAKTIMPMGFFPIFSTRIGDAMSEAGSLHHTVMVPPTNVTAVPPLLGARIVVRVSGLAGDAYVPCPTSHCVPFVAA